MVSCRSDDVRVERQLSALHRQVEVAGGLLQPEMELRCEAGDLSVACSASLKPGAVLTAIPEHCVLPVQSVELRVRSDNLCLDADADALSPVQRRLFEIVLDIYNLTGKIAAHRSSNVWVALAQVPEILNDVARGRLASQVTQDFLGYADRQDLETLLVESFLKTRTFNMHRDDQRRPVIVPIIDFLNHHTFAPGFKRTGGADAPRAMALAWRESAQSHECFVSYSYLDAYDSLLFYSFVNELAPFVRSVPLELHLKNLGQLRVHTLVGLRFNGTLPPDATDLRAYMPETLAHEEGRLDLGHLLIPAGVKPRALYRVLKVVISTMADNLTEDAVKSYARAAEQQVLAVNLAFYKDLERRVSVRRDAAPAVLDTVLAMARLQTRKLQAYRLE